MKKTIITLSVDYDTYLLAKQRLDNVSEFVNNAFKHLAESHDFGEDNPQDSISKINNSLMELKLKKDILEAQIIQKQELEVKRLQKLEERKRWKCPVCKTINSLDQSRCGGRCGLSTRDSSKTVIIYVDDLGNEVDENAEVPKL